MGINEHDKLNAHILLLREKITQNNSTALILHILI